MKTKLKETKTLSVILPLDLYNKLEESAKNKGYMTSQYVRTILSEHYNGEEKK